MSESDVIDIFGDNLRDLMIEVGISQGELADETGLDKATISRYLNKQRMPTLKAFLNICYVLECKPSDLIENYDLIYPYLSEDGTKIPLSEFKSEQIYNYDLCARSRSADGEWGQPYEILSGALREWLYEPIVERLIDNKILKVRPHFSKEGELLNPEDLEGYGPFLCAAHALSKDGQRYFPATFGGGLGIERFLFAVLKGDAVKVVDDVTYFGKNPDSHPIYLF